MIGRSGAPVNLVVNRWDFNGATSAPPAPRRARNAYEALPGTARRTWWRGFWAGAAALLALTATPPSDAKLDSEPVDLLQRV